jgi:hypothetical protein
MSFLAIACLLSLTKKVFKRYKTLPKHITLSCLGPEMLAELVYRCSVELGSIFNDPWLYRMFIVIDEESFQTLQNAPLPEDSKYEEKRRHYVLRQ